MGTFMDWYLWGVLVFGIVIASLTCIRYYKEDEIKATTVPMVIILSLFSWIGLLFFFVVTIIIVSKELK